MFGAPTGVHAVRSSQFALFGSPLAHLLPLVAFLSLFLATATLRAQTAVAPTNGDGLTTATAYQFVELGNLVWLQQQAAANRTAGTYYLLMNDIDASPTASWNDAATTTATLEGFRPIGSHSSPDTTSFRGVFDGSGHKIAGLTIDRAGTDYIGLFGCIGTRGAVRNLGLAGGAAIGSSYTGALAGSLSGGTITSCTATVAVTGTSESDARYVGGLIGYSSGSMIENCRAAGAVAATVTGTGGWLHVNYVGGLVGGSSGSSIANSRATGEVTAARTGTGGTFYANSVGGLAGICSSGVFADCSAAGAVRTTGTGTGSAFTAQSVGGLVGVNFGTIAKCYATGSVGVAYCAGGLVAENYGPVTNSYATGAVAGTGLVGGLVGYQSGETVACCYATGLTSGAGLAGLIGQNDAGTIAACYWDTESSGQASSAGGAGKTTAEMRQQGTFLPAGTAAGEWDFSAVWGIRGVYPYLRALPFHTLTYRAGAGGSVSGAASQILNPGADGTTVTATPATGYHFVKWSDNLVAAARASLSVAADLTVTAIFAPDQYTLSYSASTHGSISGATPQTVDYNCDGTTVTAVPAIGYHFVQWSDNVMTAARRDLAVTASLTVTASFAINRYSLAYAAGPNGSLDGVTSQTVTYGGDGTTVTAMASTGYHFVKWSDGVPAASRTDRDVTGDIAVTASFAINLYALAYSAGPNGSLDGATSQTVTYGGDGTTVTAAASTGYHFAQWSDGVPTAARTDRTVTNDISVTASFAINRYALSYSTGPNGSLDGVTSQTVAHGGNGTTVTAVASPGYHFAQWSDGVPTASRTDRDVTGDISVTAGFAVDPHPALAVTPSHQDLPAAAGSVEFDVANTGTGTFDWTAQVTGGGDWLTVAPGASGTNAGTVSVAVAANDTALTRTGTVTVTATGTSGVVANSPRSVTVTQAAGGQPVVGNFLARRVKSSHSEKWDAAGARVAGKDFYSFSAKVQLPAGSLASLSNATTLTLKLGDAVTSGAASEVFERPLSAAAKSTLAGNPAAKKPKDPATGGGVSFVELQASGQATSKKKALLITLKWTKTGLLTVTVIGTPAPATWNPTNPAEHRQVDNIADLCDANEWPEGPATGVTVPAFVDLQGVTAAADTITCAGKKGVKSSGGGDLIGWSVSGK